MVNSGRSGCSLTQRGNLMRPPHLKLEDGAGRARLLRGVTESCRAACERGWSGATTPTSRDGAYEPLDTMVPSMNQGDRALKNSA